MNPENLELDSFYLVFKDSSYGGWGDDDPPDESVCFILGSFGNGVKIINSTYLWLPLTGLKYVKLTGFMKFMLYGNTSGQERIHINFISAGISISDPVQHLRDVFLCA